ncbi:MAG: M48 family metallopeptidase [Flavobacteriales bacterium]|nr:M48 family metallopeptidase [Flavobacteriales bacterium]
MKKRQILGGISVIIFVFFSCSKVPITGRKQLNLLPESQLIGMSNGRYTQFLSENKKVETTNSDGQMVKRVGEKIAKAVAEFLKKDGSSKRVSGFKWEFNLVENKMVNAWCMPGGKVVVYTGIVGVAKDEAGLAVVMGHEIAHAIARHGNERMSQQLAIQAGGISLSLLTSDQPELAKGLFNQAYGLGSNLGILAYSRNHETEADKLGLVFMAMAGYDPREAPKFWERMSALGGQKPPEMLSTHPGSETRISDLNDFMVEALKYYK